MTEENRELKNAIFAARAAAEKVKNHVPTEDGSQTQQRTAVGYQNVIAPAGMPAKQNQIEFDLPVADVPLPSRGLIYSSPSLSGVESLAVRGMVAGDENILMNRALAKKGTVITELIKACLLDKNVDVRNLISGDRTALMFAIRIAAHGPTYSAKVTCPSCDKKNEWEIDLNSLPIREMNPDVLEQVVPYQNAFKYVLPVTKKTVIFKFLTGIDEEEMLREAEAKKKANLVDDNIVTNSMAKMILSVDGIEERNKIINFCKHMPLKDSSSFRKFVAENEPTLVTRSNFSCPECDHEEEMAIELSPTFFWPDA